MNTQNLKVKWFEDPGHAWLKVELRWLIELGIADKITRYSYRLNDFVFLEEDLDAGTFLNTAEAAGWTFHFGPAVRDERESSVRRLASYVNA